MIMKKMMMNFHHLYCWFLPFFYFFTSTSWAEIIFDGTLGTPTTLTGPDYTLNAHLGQQVGENLFHSFDRFNVGRGETAVFESSPSILNIIGRITGGEASFIDGTLKSPSNLYLLNPYGIAIGKQAQLDIQGSLHLSSADYLGFSDQQQFVANPSSPPLLTMATPESFGFLEHAPAEITIEGDLKVAPRKDISVTGGNLSIKGSDFYAPGGQITLNGLGKVSIENSFWDEDAPQGGSVRIQSETFSMHDSIFQLRADTSLGSIEILSRGTLRLSGTSGLFLFNRQGRAGNIFLRGQSIDISEGSSIYTATHGTGEGSPIQLNAEEYISLTGSQSRIVAATNGKGRGGDVTLQAQHIQQQGGFMTTKSTSFGQAGDINIHAPGDLSLSHAGEISNLSFKEGHAGRIFIHAGHLVMTEGSHIVAASWDRGHGGEVSIDIQEAAQLEGYQINTDGKMNPTGIATRVMGQGLGGRLQIFAPLLSLNQFATIQTSTRGEGQAGDIVLKVHELRLFGGADIDASNEIQGTGSGGYIDIQATQVISIAAIPADPDFIGPSRRVIKEGFLGGIYSTSESDWARGGDINLFTPKLILQEGGTISAGSVGLGHAGHLNIKVTDELILDHAAILTRAEKAKGGHIDIGNPFRFHLRDSEISTEAKGQQLTDRGGDIQLSSQSFLTLNHSSILARAVGNGGEITLRSKIFIQSTESLLDASSKLGLAGKVQIHTSEENLKEMVTLLPTAFFETDELLKKNCLEHLERSSLVINYRKSLPETPQALGVYIPAKLLEPHH